MFSAVLLASRLPDTTHVFLFMVIAIELFALFPVLRDFIRVRSESIHFGITAVLFCVTCTLLLIVSADSTQLVFNQKAFKSPSLLPS